MPKTEITIERSSQVVWDFLTKTENWEKWWGASMIKVQPRWESGATIVWGNGDQSKLTSIISQKEIRTSSMFMETGISLKLSGKFKTRLEYEFNPSGGASFSDGGRAHKTTLDLKLVKLKDCIERESEVPGKSKSKTWRPWGKGKKELLNRKKPKEKGPLSHGKKCDFCGKVVHEGEGISVISSQAGNVDDVFSAAQDAAEKMLSSKYVCSGCQAVLCLECGNRAGQKLGLGTTNCPNCGTKVS